MNEVQIGNWLLIAAAIPANGAALFYGFLIEWWRSPWGRHLLAYMAVIALLLNLGLIRLAFGDSAWFAAIRVLAFMAFVFTLWWRWILFIQAYREGPADRPPTRPEGANR